MLVIINICTIFTCITKCLIINSPFLLQLGAVHRGFHQRTYTVEFLIMFQILLIYLPSATTVANWIYLRLLPVLWVIVLRVFSIFLLSFLFLIRFGCLRGSILSPSFPIWCFYLWVYWWHRRTDPRKLLVIYKGIIEPVTVWFFYMGQRSSV